MASLLFLDVLLFHYGAVGGVDCTIDVRPAFGIRVGDRNPANRRSSGDMGARISIVLGRVDQRVVLVGVAMWPAIDRDRGNVAFYIETRVAESIVQLLLQELFVIVKAHLEQAPSSRHVLFAFVQALAGRAHCAYGAQY